LRALPTSLLFNLVDLIGCSVRWRDFSSRRGVAATKFGQRAPFVGGLLVSQVLALFTTPVVYIYLDHLGNRLGRRHAAGAKRGIVVREADAS